MTSGSHMFLVVWPHASREAEVEDLGHDVSAALEALKAKEREVDGADTEVVLLEADSLAALKRSHASYFGETTSPAALRDRGAA